ncbi:MAG: hypothetical protein GXO79_05790 [Chlorobi bacterium]|nr:hypothetical protein [Chlorobiota bacterium]
MKLKLLLFSITIVLTNQLLFSQETIKLSGNLYNEQRIRPQNNYNWSWNENRLDLQIQKKLKDKFKFYSNVWLRNITYPDYRTIYHLYSKDALYPYNLQLREAYVEIYDFLFKNLDVTFGKQRIAWGKADKLNPTDNLNPYDLEDIWDFGRHNGSEALRAIYYINDFSVEGIFIPYFRPDNLPIGDWSTSLSTQIALPAGLEVNNIYTSVIQPKLNLKENSQYGFKINGLLSGFDFSLSYLYGRDGLGLPASTSLIPVDTQFVNFIPVAINTDIYASLFFPRYHIIGADFAGSVGPFGVWGEAAVFQPTEKSILTTDLSLLYPFSPVPVIQDSVILDKKPFIKFVLGSDIQFGNGFYFNLQYLHGFINERGKDALNDYFMGQLEKSFYNDKLKIVPVSGGLIISDWKNVKNNYALIYAPEITYKPNDDIALTVSYRLLNGKGNNLFALLKDKDELIFKVLFNF